MTAVNKLKRAFDVSTTAQEAALASLGETAEVERRRRVNTEQRATVERILRAHGFEPALPAVANFLYVETGATRARCSTSCYGSA